MLVESIVCKCLGRRGEERLRPGEEVTTARASRWREGLGEGREAMRDGVRDSRGCGRLEGANRIVINVKWRREQGTENGGAS